MTLTPDHALRLEDFPDFVQEVRGHRPFPWQTAYLHQVADSGTWPDMDVPTGLGKTSIIDIWVFLLAWQHTAGTGRTVPLRLFFVVDRRLVVDQAHDSARALQHALDTALPDTVTGRVARALRDLGGSGTALESVRMRGGVDWASRWLRSPAQPAVITSTVDQYGSRLLFRGYHTSPRMRPIDAALCGMDALLAVDEAHIALPLLVTATDCAAYQATATHPEFADRAVKVVSLSATASTGPGRPRHSITGADRTHPVAGRRLSAQRRLTLLDAASGAKDTAEAFALAAQLAVDTLLPMVERPVIGVVGNTIRAARATHRLLSQRQDIDVVLLTGRSRTLDRERLLTSTLVTELLAGVRGDRAKPLVVVATQTVEVGIDISFAGLITENAALAALIQRLGRLDRTGGLHLAPALVIRASTQTGQSSIPVYGEAAEHTWNWLASQTSALPADGVDTTALAEVLPDGLLVNPLTLPGLLADVDATLLNVAPPRIPVVHRTLLDSWTRTSPTPVPDQAPAPFLHGLDTTPEDVQILWRADLHETEGRPNFDEWAARMRQVPPHPAETVAIPAAQLRRFLTRAPDADDTSDLESTSQPQDPAPTPKKQKQPRMSPVLSYNEVQGEWIPVTEAKDIRPGSTVVLPSHYGGHDSYGWTGTRDLPACDLGDYPTTTTAPTRIHAPLLSLLAGGDQALTEALTKTITRAVGLLHTGEQEETTIVHNLLDTLLDHLNRHTDGAYADLAHDRLSHLRTVGQWTVEPTGRTEHCGRVVLNPDEPDRLLLIPPHPPEGQQEQGAGVGDESADASSLTRPVPLSQHSQAVADRTAAYATALTLTAELIDTLHTAGHAHDCGKAHSGFQCMLCAGDRLLAESLDEPRAKSGMDAVDHVARRRAARLAQWNPEMRHEALSALAVTAWLDTRPDYARGNDDELLIHLVAAHHGHARPLLPPVTDPFPRPVTCTMPDRQQITVHSSDMGTDWSGPDRFHALNRRYGPWGLALLEATLRLADMACSEEGT
ncbi:MULTISPECIES: type I-U CRISPR-associated helicase/endonuclease Cas3 [unclassified Streptomyces]|uniref:type I-G CRISPR-associated helicase/endonuclease Cas3g n=1 Tax=unclassified Streptomyces TaxID=2593676 RepID=UPI001BE988C7|nr:MULTISPECIES: type I-U CRISPR-associated helicase/endonuclease Cas3 [unclassified Streptomyces]MBT2404609.1 type I-U CRISPR-associated helicase/endonuclease Cas3 [Streptomyces sp. ISL-21]MBT2610491.1 type I-U CRISPR-associated helicase/endonuclease Cas3 [Streptomyces sp. ISL-87]